MRMSRGKVGWTDLGPVKVSGITLIDFIHSLCWNVKGISSASLMKQSLLDMCYGFTLSASLYICLLSLSLSDFLYSIVFSSPPHHSLPSSPSLFRCKIVEIFHYTVTRIKLFSVTHFCRCYCLSASVRRNTHLCQIITKLLIHILIFLFFFLFFN